MLDQAEALRLWRDRFPDLEARIAPEDHWSVALEIAEERSFDRAGLRPSSSPDGRRDADGPPPSEHYRHAEQGHFLRAARAFAALIWEEGGVNLQNYEVLRRLYDRQRERAPEEHLHLTEAVRDRLPAVEPVTHLEAACRLRALAAKLLAGDSIEVTAAMEVYLVSTLIRAGDKLEALDAPLLIEAARQAEADEAVWVGRLRGLAYVLDCFETLGHPSLLIAPASRSDSERGEGLSVNEERVIKVGQELLRAQRTAAAWVEEFKGITNNFLDWAGGLVCVSRSQIRKAFEETGCFGREGKRGATGRGLIERIENIMDLARHHPPASSEAASSSA